MDAIIGIFSDMPAGTVIFLAVLAGLCLKYSAGNIFRDKGGGRGSSNSGGSSHEGSNSGGSDSVL